MKPGDLFLGALDLFGILMPGIVLAAILYRQYGCAIDALLPGEMDATGRLVGFFVGGYIVGHLAFMMGVALDFVYDRVRRWVWPIDRYPAYLAATRVRQAVLGDAFETAFNDCQDGRREAINTYRWAMSSLLARAPAAHAEVVRIEADQKLFRTLVVVAITTAVVAAMNRMLWHAGIAFALGVACFLRYVGQRFKSTRRAYEHVIALKSLGTFDARGDVKDTAA